MREIEYAEIRDAVARACVSMNLQLPADVLGALAAAREAEPEPGAVEVLDRILENAAVADRERLPLCQDTGLVSAFVELGSGVAVRGGELCDAINAGVVLGYEEGLLRKSVVAHPLDRKNTGTNAPALVSIEPGARDRLVIRLLAKGAGSENMGRIRMFNPTAPVEEIESFVVGTVAEAGPNPCPPVIVGVGLGGAFDKSAQLAKRALLIPLDRENPDPILARMESSILERVNRLGIGPLGFGGRTTALGVRILAHPCHIASLPAAVNLNCHSARRAEVEL